MPLPAHQLKDLRERGEAHERRILVLRNAIRAAQEELQVHEILAGLTRDKALIAALGKLYKDSRQCKNFARNPNRYCAEHGISLPPEVTLHSAKKRETSIVNARVRAGEYEVEVVWDPNSGFDARPLKGFDRHRMRRDDFYELA